MGDGDGARASSRSTPLVTGVLGRQAGVAPPAARVLRSADGRNPRRARAGSSSGPRAQRALGTEIWGSSTGLRGRPVDHAHRTATPPLSSRPSGWAGPPNPLDRARPDRACGAGGGRRADAGPRLAVDPGGRRPRCGRVWRIPLLGETARAVTRTPRYGKLRADLAAYYRLNHNRLGVGVEAALSIPRPPSREERLRPHRPDPHLGALEFQFGAALAMRPTNGGLMRAFVGMVYHQFDLDTSTLSPEMRLAPVTYVGLRVAGEGRSDRGAPRGSSA